jgi:hypothetical protein
MDALAFEAADLTLARMARADSRTRPAALRAANMTLALARRAAVRTRVTTCCTAARTSAVDRRMAAAVARAAARRCVRATRNADSVTITGPPTRTCNAWVSNFRPAFRTGSRKRR